jgi:CheY-like chemotaxis protein
MDLRLPGRDGTATLLEIRKVFADARVVMLTTSESDGDIQRAMRARAAAYILKSMPKEEILSIIRSVHKRGRFVPTQVAALIAMLVVAFAGSSMSAQLTAAPLSSTQGAAPRVQAAGNGTGYTLRVTTREVVVEVVARGHNNHPISDLKQADFQVFDGGRKSRDTLRTISGFRTIDPASESFDRDEGSRNVLLPLGGRCEIRTTVHYEIAFHPGKWVSGYHSIVVTTTRHHVTLSYRAQYYVGVSDAEAHPARREAKGFDAELQSAACYRSSVPSSLSLSAREADALDSSELRYVLKLLPGSPDFAGVDDASHRVQLEYGVCTFNRAGRVIGYWHFSEDRLLDRAELDKVLNDGWSESVEVPLTGHPSLARFVVLERKSGNLGSVDLSTDSQRPLHESGRGVGKKTLGSAVPGQGALCGDVYELPTTTKFLPADFQVLNAVGAVYTDSLDVPEQILGQGIPGSTPRSEWFGIDYFGEFWISKPGKYLFVLDADDGADLYIDDHQLIGNDGIHPPQTVSKSIRLEAGRHTLHLPYFQGTYIRQSHPQNPTARRKLEGL